MSSPFRILIINPNSTTSMTDSLRQPIESLGYSNTTYTYFTAPRPSPRSIDDLETAATSSEVTFPHLLPHLPTHDAFLVACYSPHPLVWTLKRHTLKPVLGIFEASISTALHLLASEQRFGIVSTGESWKYILGDSIRGELLGAEKAERVFAGVETLGLNAVELHGEGAEGKVKKNVMAAAGRLLESGNDGRGKVKVMVLGCAGMAGMEEWIREEVQSRGKEVRVVDGVKAGVGILQGIGRGLF